MLDTLAGPVRAEIEVARSRFVCDLAPAADEGAAAAVLAAARREFHDARHHGSAWVLGPDGDTVRWNDDGEPSGTTGAPMLAVLQGAALSDVVAVVTRYFGGTLLGAGGLVRAYGDAVRAALSAAERVARRTLTVVEVTAGHAQAGRLEHHLRHLLGAFDGHLDDVRYEAASVRFVLALPEGADGELEAALAGSGLDHEVGTRGTRTGTLPG
ncbi:DUF1949 domain-containing protein [Nitriliruptoraceae bacterium ZYF776]|nr:DUF1949 domain-containing protein [Profundirhabdus halotolerans]